MGIDRNDVDWANGLLTVRNSKYGKSREILLHSSTVTALRAYHTAQRDRLSSFPSAPSFFVSTRGTRLLHETVQPTFRQLLRQVGLEPRSPSCRPRIHSFRHSFAVNTLVRWYRDGGDVAARMPLLSTYLGHVDPAATYWYLSATPELLAPSCRSSRDSCSGPAMSAVAPTMEGFFTERLMNSARRARTPSGAYSGRVPAAAPALCRTKPRQGPVLLTL